MKGLRSVAISAVIALVLYLTIASGIDAHAVVRAVMRLGWYGWGVILGLSLVNYGLRFARWHYYLRFLGHRLAVERDLTIYVAGFAMTATPGKAGEAVRSLYLRPHGVSYGHSLAALFSERFSDLMAMLVLATLGALTFTRYAGALVAALIGAVLILTLIQRPALLACLQRLATQAGRRWVRAMARNLAEPLAASSQLLRSRPLYIGLLLGGIGWGAEGVALYYIAQVLGIPLDPALALAIYAISVLVGALSFLPGGLGSTEAAMGILLTLVGGSPALAVACTLITRVATLWFAVLLGVCALVALELANRSHKPQAKRL